MYVNVPERFRALGWAAWRESLAELSSNLEVCWWLTRRDIVSRYRQSVIGIGWAVLTPLATMGVFVFLNRVDLLSVESTELPYPLFVLTGLLPWQLFSATLTRSTQSLVSAPQLVNRVRFPREILVLSAAGSALFDFAVGALVLAGVFAWYGQPPAWTLLLLPVLLLLQVLFSLALGLVLAVLNAATRDLGSIVPFAVLLWMFLTPVLYPPAVEGRVAWLNWVNPMSAFIVGHRDLLIRGALSMPGQLAAASALGLLLLPLAWRLFHLMSPRVAETV